MGWWLQLMNWEECESKWSCHIFNHIQAFIWGNWGKPFYLTIENWTGWLPRYWRLWMMYEGMCWRKWLQHTTQLYHSICIEKRDKKNFIQYSRLPNQQMNNVTRKLTLNNSPVFLKLFANSIWQYTCSLQVLPQKIEYTISQLFASTVPFSDYIVWVKQLSFPVT
jgi:hypothetical protein